MATISMQAFCNTCNDFHIEKTELGHEISKQLCKVEYQKQPPICELVLCLYFSPIPKCLGWWSNVFSIKDKLLCQYHSNGQ